MASDRLEGLVEELNGILRSGSVDLHLKLGRLIIERLFDGDASSWRARGTRDASFRRLAAHAGRDLALSASTLYRCVALCELADRIGAGVWRRVGVSHLRAVLGLPDQQQRQLLHAAEVERWTVERLAGEATKARAAQRRGRPPLPPVVKTVHKLARMIADPQRAFSGLDRLPEVNDRDILRLYEDVVATVKRLRALETQLGPRRQLRS